MIINRVQRIGINKDPEHTILWPFETILDFWGAFSILTEHFVALWNILYQECQTYYDFFSFFQTEIYFSIYHSGKLHSQPGTPDQEMTGSEQS